FALSRAEGRQGVVVAWKWRRQPTRDLVEQLTGHRRRELGIARGHRADRGDQLLDRRVLEEEAACPGPQGFEDVLVEAERGEDQDLLVWHPSSGLDPVDAG